MGNLFTGITHTEFCRTVFTSAQIARFVQICATFLLIMFKCGHTIGFLPRNLLTFAERNRVDCYDGMVAKMDERKFASHDQRGTAEVVQREPMA